MEQKKKALLKGSAVTVILYYVIFFILLILIGTIWKQPECTEYADNDQSGFMITMFASLNIISSAIAIPVGQSFVRRYDRTCRWKITQALIVSLLIVVAMLLIGYFQPAIYLIICIFMSAPVLLIHYIVHIVRYRILRKKRQ